MTHNEYEQRKRRLDEQLRVGIEWLQAAHRQQVEALNLLRANDGGADETSPAVDLTQAVPPPAPSEPQTAGRPRRRAGELYNEVRGILDKMPEVFDRNHVCEQLGYEPDRGSLYRTLEQLKDEGLLAREAWGAGRTPSRYRKRNTGRGEAEA